MQLDALSPATKAVFGKIAKLPIIKNFYLAGGSAVALFHAHRYSYDLDFFSDQSFNATTLTKLISKLGKLKTETLEEDTLLGTLDGVKISFFRYRYPLVYSAKYMGTVKVADQRDLAAMKLQAISSRGTKRDFVDLYWLLKQNHWTLMQAIDWFEKRYQGMNLNLVHLLKSLVYFSDADNDKIEMIKPADWNLVKDYFKRAVKEIKL